MSVLVLAWNIEDGEDRFEIGVFDSIQMTGDILRDDDNNTILEYENGDWIDRGGRFWYDWTVEAVR